MNVRLYDRARASLNWWHIVLFGALCGMLAESLEVLLLQTGGVLPPGWELRGALWLTYAVIGAGLLTVASLLMPRRALVAASIAFALVLVLPWLNFSVLPRWASLRSLLGNAAAVLMVVALVPILVRLRRVTIAAIAVLALWVNLWPFLASSGSTPGQRSAASKAPPFNIMVVLIDTLRADHLGAYGYDRPTSPNFDALASDGVLFKRTTSQAAWTKPSVASLMTAAFVHKHGVVGSRDALGDQYATLAEAMRERGYRTAAFSGNPWITPEFRFDRGFDEFEAGRAMAAQLTSLYKLLRRLDRALGARGLRTNFSGLAFWGASGNLSNCERDRILTDAAESWIAENGDEPFFLYMHLMGPHDPYDPPAEYVGKFREPNWDGRLGPRVPPPRVQTIFDHAQPLPEPELSALIAQYDAAVAYSDAQLGRLVDALRRAGQLDRTLIVVTADHGEEFYEHRNWRHGNQLYNEVVHVPLLFHLPGKLPAERRTDLSMVVDIFPTVVDLVDQTSPANGIDGRALFAAGRNGEPTAFSEHWSFEGGTYVSRMVRQGALKLQETRDEARGQERAELYDLAGDAQEQRNLLENPDAVRENGVGELQSLLARFGDKVSVESAVSVDVDQTTQERLRQLGY